MDCTAPATVEGSYRNSERLFLSCDACLEGMLFDQHQRIEPPKASKALKMELQPPIELQPANDLGANYRRARDGG